MANNDSETEIYGAFDGLTAGTGVLLATSALGPHAVLLAFKGLIVSETIGMAAGRYLSMSKASKQERFRQTFVMAGAAFLGCVWLALPYFFFKGAAAQLLSVSLWLIGGLAIGALRKGNYRTYIETFVILLLVVLVLKV